MTTWQAGYNQGNKNIYYIDSVRQKGFEVEFIRKIITTKKK